MLLTNWHHLPLLINWHYLPLLTNWHPPPLLTHHCPLLMSLLSTSPHKLSHCHHLPHLTNHHVPLSLTHHSQIIIFPLSSHITVVYLCSHIAIAYLCSQLVVIPSPHASPSSTSAHKLSSSPLLTHHKVVDTMSLPQKHGGWCIYWCKTLKTSQASAHDVGNILRDLRGGMPKLAEAEAMGKAKHLSICVEISTGSELCTENNNL